MEEGLLLLKKVNESLRIEIRRKDPLINSIEKTEKLQLQEEEMLQRLIYRINHGTMFQRILTGLQP